MCRCVVTVGALLLASLSCLAADEATRETRQARLEASVNALATTIGERNTRKPDNLRAAEAWVADQLGKAGLKVIREPYEVDGQTVANVYVEVRGNSEPDRWVVVGAHYDSAPGTPGANDNASGVAALIELAQAVSKTPGSRSVRFVALVNEEPPFFQTGAMGSLIHADGCKRRNEQIDAMISIETIGCFSDAEKSQHFPPGLEARYPTVGNFIAVVGDLKSGTVATAVSEHFNANADLPTELAVLPAEMPGVGWSDHWSFWQHDYPAVMITDTAPFRYPHYHRPTDTPDKIDYVRMTKVVVGLEKSVVKLANAPTTKPATP